MSQVVQVELRTDTTHTVLWVDANLKPKPGMHLVCKGDARVWEVVHAYPASVQEMSDINMGWKVGGL